jgi:microcystin-dependent protein
MWGEYTHKLTEEEMPKHKHEILKLFTRGGQHARMSGRWNSNGGWTENAGGDEPHNNVQPSTVVNIWRRVS